MKYVVLAFLFLFACGKKDNSNNSDGQPPNPGGFGITAGNPEEALELLSEADGQLLEQWKAKFIKSCSGSEIFEPEKERASQGIDLSVYYKKHGPDLMLETSEGMVFLGNPVALPGESSSKYEHSHDVNGKKYKIEARLERKGLACDLWLFGQKVHTARIAQKIPVVAYADPSVAVDPVSIRVSSQQLSDGTLRITQHGIGRIVEEFLFPRKKVSAVVASHVGVSEKGSDTLFEPALNLDPIFKITSPQESYWFGNGLNSIVGTSRNVSSLYGDGESSAKFLTRIRINQFKHDPIKSVEIQSHKSRSVQLEIEAKITLNENGSYRHQIMSAEAANVQMTEGEGVKCFEETGLRYLDLDSSVRSLSPRYHSLFSLCRPLEADLSSKLHEHPSGFKVVSHAMSLAAPSKKFEYLDWGRFYSDLAIENYSKEKGLIGAFPAAPTDLITRSQNALDGVESTVEVHPELVDHNESLQRTSLSWVLSDQNIHADQVSRFGEALANAAPTFEKSTVSVLRNAWRNFEKVTEEIDFALRLTDEYKQLAQKVRQLAQDIGHQKWVTNYFNAVLQVRPDKGRLEEWVQNFEAVKNRVEGHENLHAVRSDVTEILLNAYERREIVSISDENILRALSNVIRDFPKPTAKLLKKLKSSIAENSGELDFARSIDSKYKEACQKLGELANQVFLNAWASKFLENALEHAEPQSTIDSWLVTLAASKQFLDRDRKRFTSTPSFYESHRKSLLMKAIQERWHGREFELTERISLLATQKHMCDRYKDVVSLVDCAGKDYFSNKDGKLLNPVYGNRYGVLGEDWSQQIIKLQPEFDYSTTRRGLLSSFFDSFGKIVWSQCGAAVFEGNRQKVSQKVSELKNTSDQFRRWDIEKDIKQLLKDCS